MASNIDYVLSLENSAFLRSLQACQGAMSNFKSAVMAPLAGLAGIIGGMVGVVSAAALMKQAMSKASEMEDLEVSFSVLLGSMDKAKQRMAELDSFARSTPFELPGVAVASRTLETLTRGALSTGSGLRMVGDLAAGVQQPFEDLAMHVGRLYDGLQSGRAVGESLMRLQELGIVSGSVRTQIEQLQEQGKKGEAVWSVAANAFARFSGTMEARSKTFSGTLSNLSEAFSAMLREFARPINDALKPLIQSFTAALDGLQAKAREIGQSVAGAISTAFQLFQDGKLGTTAGKALELGFLKATDFLKNALTGILAGAGVGLGEAINVIVMGLSNSSMWTGLGKIMTSAALNFVATIQEGMSTVFESAGFSQLAAKFKEMATISRIGQGAAADGALRDFTSTDFRPIVEAAVSGAIQAGKAVTSAFNGPANPRIGTLHQDIDKDLAAAAESLKKAKTGQLFENFFANAYTSNFKKPEEDVATGKGGKLQDMDRLARIGGFIGGAGGPALDYARRTAVAVEKMASKNDYAGRDYNELAANFA